MALAAYLNPGGDLAAGVDCVKLAETPRLRQRVGHARPRPRFLPGPGCVRAPRPSRIGLGNGVVPVYPRHPVAMAQAALTLNELAGGRFRLGIGVSHQAHDERHARPRGRRATHRHARVRRGTARRARRRRRLRGQALSRPLEPGPADAAPRAPDLPGRARTQDVRAGRRDRRRRDPVAVPARLRAGRGAPGDRARTRCERARRWRAS